MRDKGICAICNVDTLTSTHRRWEMDHIVPIVEGGGLCGLDGYRTLCIACHKTETAALRKRLSRKRKHTELNFKED